MVRFPAFIGVSLLIAQSGCTRNDTPLGPGTLIPPSFAFVPGQTISYTRRNFDANHNPVSMFQHEVTVLAYSGNGPLPVGTPGPVATVCVTTSEGSAVRLDTVLIAAGKGGMEIFDLESRRTGRVPLLPLWSTLIDLSMNPAPDTVLSYDSTFTVALASGHLLRDRVMRSVVTRYAGEDRIHALGAPIINCFVYTRTVYGAETVDTAGVLLFQGPVMSFLDSLWFADGIGPVLWTSRGSAFETDSLGLPFSSSALQAVCTDASFDSYEVHYARVNGNDLLVLRVPLYEIPPLLYTVTEAFAKNF